MTIAEISELFGMTIDTLRYYERIGLIPPVKRSGGGTRIYSELDCRWIAYIKCMRNAGISIETLVEYVALFQKGDKTQKARLEILKEQRTQIAQHLEELQNTLKRLDTKIEIYESNDFSFEKILAKGGESEWDDMFKSVEWKGEIINCGADGVKKGGKAVSLSPMSNRKKKSRKRKDDD
jgi:DNA-binding transcriptional MerR regulator